MQRGQLDEAIPWLKKAMAAERYEPQHFPHLNLGEIWILKGRWDDALASFEESILVTTEDIVPRLPAIPVSLPPDTGDMPPPPDFALDDLTEVMNGYFQTWNAYNPSALMEKSSGPHHQDSGEAKIRESTAGVSRKPSSDGKARGSSSKHLWGLTAWNT